MEGRLVNLELHELLHLCINTMITGALEVTTPVGLHRLCWQDGQLLHAVGPTGVGFAALWPLFELDDATYRLDVNARTSQRTIQESTSSVIDRARHTAAEWRQIRPLITDCSVVPVLCLNPSTELVCIKADDWPVLAWIDGERTIIDIASVTGFEDLMICQSLIRMQHDGYISFDAKERSSPVVQGPAPAPLTPGRAASRMLNSAPYGFEQQDRPTQRQSGLFGNILANLPVEPAPEPVPQWENFELPPTLSTEDIIRMLGIA